MYWIIYFKLKFYVNQHTQQDKMEIMYTKLKIYLKKIIIYSFYEVITV